MVVKGVGDTQVLLEFRWRFGLYICTTLGDKPVISRSFVRFLWNSDFSFIETLKTQLLAAIAFLLPSE